MEMTLGVRAVVAGVLFQTTCSQWLFPSLGCRYPNLNGCLQSANYPNSYPLADTCVAYADPVFWAGKVVDTRDFDVDASCDKFRMNGIDYQGSSGPRDIRPSGEIRWQADNIACDPSDSRPRGWKICSKVAPSTTVASTDTDGGSNGNNGDNGFNKLVIILGITIPLLSVCACGISVCACGILLFWYLGKRKGKDDESTGRDDYGEEDWDSEEVSSASESEEDSYPTAAPTIVQPATPARWIAERRPCATPISMADLKVPPYWSNSDISQDFNKLEATDSATMDAIQSMITSTFKKGVKTQDRVGQIPKGLNVVQAHRIENSTLWKKYVTGRHAVASKRPHRCTPMSRISGEVLTTSRLSLLDTRGLNNSINEVFLCHGTSPKGATGIRGEGFQLKWAGTNVGSMYGSGVYFAECSSKCDEYAKDDKDGLFQGMYCMILCRVVLGEVLHMTAGGDATHQAIKALIEGGSYDSVLGDRQASVGTYREFVVYHEDQIYPEYLVIYRREY